MKTMYQGFYSIELTEMTTKTKNGDEFTSVWTRKYIWLDGKYKLVDKEIYVDWTIEEFAEYLRRLGYQDNN